MSTSAPRSSEKSHMCSRAFVALSGASAKGSRRKLQSILRSPGPPLSIPRPCQGRRHRDISAAPQSRDRHPDRASRVLLPFTVTSARGTTMRDGVADGPCRHSPFRWRLYIPEPDHASCRLIERQIGVSVRANKCNSPNGLIV